MWSDRSTRWHIGLCANKVVRVTLAGAWHQRVGSFDEQACTPDPDAAPWLAATAALTRLLQEDAVRARPVRIVLSGRFVRWQLLAWHPELTRQQEVATLARLRFAQTFGELAGDWTVLHAPQPPGQAIPACAVDTALVQALRGICKDAGTRLESVTPYFAGAAQHWHSALVGQGAWFGVIESDWVSLGLLHKGAWIGLHAQRADADWSAVLPGMMAQIGIGAGMAESAWPVYLVGAGDRPAPGVVTPWVRLQPPMAMPGASPVCRLALGL